MIDIEKYKSEYQQEENEILEYLVNTIYVNGAWSDNLNNFRRSEALGYGIDLFITSACNQACEYCYLYKHQDKLYPKEIRNPKQILENFKILCDWFIKNKVVIPNLTPFSGEIWGTNFSNQFFDILLDAISQGLIIKNITIPSNMSFIFDQKKQNCMDYYWRALTRYGVGFCISSSMDGAFVEKENRPFIDKTKIEKINTEDYCNAIVDYAFKHHWGFHPMIAAETIEKQKENYLWWREKFKEYNQNTKSDWYDHIMLFEVRSNNWTTEKITSYLDWMNFMYNTEIEDFWKDNEIMFIYKVFLGNSKYYIQYKNGDSYKTNLMDEDPKTISYSPLGIRFNGDKNISCSAGKTLNIRLGDLAIIPCHRTSYTDSLFGKFKVENDKIIGIDALKPELMFTLLGQSCSTMFKCDSCSLNKLCLNGCLGNQYEVNYDYQGSVDEVCEFNFARFLFIYYKEKSIIKKYNLDSIFIIDDSILDGVYNKIKEETSWVIEKWEPIISQLI